MKTIVINTSDEAKKTGLYDLFKAPFDENSLLWYDIRLDAIAEMACRIKEKLITNTDIVDRDYHMIVLVDLNNFPYGNNKEYLNMYKALVCRYVCDNLVNKLCKEYNLASKGVTVYFVDAPITEGGFDISKLAKNTDEQILAENEGIKANEEKHSKSSSGTKGNLCDEGDLECKFLNRSDKEKNIMQLFSWTEENFNDWRLRVSFTQELFLDFSESFSVVKSAAENSSEKADKLGSILTELVRVFECENGDWTKTAQVKNPGLSSEISPVLSISCTIKRDNEQSKIEGFFAVFANIFKCIRDKKLYTDFTQYDKDKIKELLVDALKKYKYFMSDKRITLHFEPIGILFKVKDAIYSARKEASREGCDSEDSFASDDSAAVADRIMSNKTGYKGAPSDEGMPTVNKFKLSGLDKKFYSLIEDVFASHDPELISYQNSSLVKNCLSRLWKWRDKETSDDFRNTVVRVVADSQPDFRSEEEMVDENNIEMALNVDKCESEYTELINKITGAQHLLASNENVLLEAKNLIIKYAELMRKGRNYIIATVGAILAVAATVLPFVYVMHYSSAESLIHKGLYACYLVLFIALYVLASSIYLSKIAKKKRKIIEELGELKKLSEEERRESIIALHKFYTDTVINAENHWLFWREVFRRKRENERKGAMRNSHKMNLQRLINTVGGFMTMLKIGVNVSECEATEEDVEKYNELGLVLCGEETFYTDGNKRIYSFLPVTEEDEEGGNGTK